MTLTASVMMIGGIPKSPMPSPLIMPISAPAARSSGITQTSGASWPPESSVTSTAAQFSTHGSERSMPPPMMTKVCPSATMPTNAASTAIDRR